MTFFRNQQIERARGFFHDIVARDVQLQYPSPPAEMSNLFGSSTRAAWFRSDYGVGLDPSGNVRVWENIWRNGDAKQANASARLAYTASVIGGKPALVGDGVSTFITATLASPVPSGSRPFIFWVGKHAVANANYLLMLYNGLEQITLVAPDTNAHIFEMGNAAVVSEARLIDGATQYNGSGAVTTSALGALSILVHYSGGKVAGSISEIIILKDEPSAADKQAALDYLSARYSIPLAGALDHSRAVNSGLIMLL